MSEASLQVVVWEGVFGSSPNEVLGDKMSWLFPLRTCYGIPVSPHPGSFAYPRKGSKHTGVDLYTDLGEPVYAVEDGLVVGIEHFTGEWDASPWWNNTDCVLVKGPSGVVNYGEIKPEAYIRSGFKIHKGDQIGTVLRVIKEGRDHYEITGWRPTMLHLELYPEWVKKASHGFEEDILKDATPFLIESEGSDSVKMVSYSGYTP